MPTKKSDIDQAVEDIKDIMKEKKGSLLIQCKKDLPSNKTISPVDVDEEEEKELTGIRIITGTVIDSMIGGGIGVGESAMLYGEFAAGKTQTVFTMVALCKGIIVYIDTENTFSFKRLKQICDARGIDYQDVKKRLILYKPKNWLEQLIVARSIPAPEELKPNKIDLIICDSIIKFFRGVEFTGRETLPLKTGFLREFIDALEQNAISHGAGIVYTDQVSEKPAMTAYTSLADTQKPVGGHSVTHAPTYTLFFRKGKGNIRVIRMMDSSNNELQEKAVVINARGIDDLPKGAKAAKGYEEGSKKFEEKQSQEEQISAKAKKEFEKAKAEGIEKAQPFIDACKEIEENSEFEETEESEENEEVED